MIRLLTLIFGLSFAVPSFGVGAAGQYSGLGWNSFSVEEYQVRCDNLCVLVSDADQRWLYLTNKMGVYSQAYRDRAIADCKALSKKPSTCRVIDENLESDFIKNFSNSSEQIATNPDTTKTVQPLAVAEAQPTEADKNIETDGDNIVYQECYSLVHSGFVTPGSQKWQISWKDIVTDSPVPTVGGPRYDMEVNKVLSMCEPFLSEDLLTWTAPLPDELEACQAIADNPKSCMFQAGSKTITSEQIATNPDTTKTVQPFAVAEAQPTEADKNIETDGDVAPDASISAMLPSPTPSVAAEIEQAPAVAEAQPTEADKNIETDADVASDDIYNQSGPSLGALLEALQAFDQLMQSEVEEQFPGSSGSASIEMAQNTSSEVSPASRAFSIESKSPETEKIRGLWKSDANCYVHIYETYDGSLGGAAWGGKRESGELRIDIAPERRFPWERIARSADLPEGGHFDPASSGRFIVDLYDSDVLHSDFSPCFLRKGSAARWNRLSHWYDADPDPNLYPGWYRRVYGAVVDDINTKSQAALEAKRKQDEARRIAEEKKAEEERKRKEAERLAAEKKAEEERLAAEKKAEEERLAAEKKAEEERIRQAALEQAKRVTRVQSGLKTLDVYEGQINGILDTNTLAALAKWATLRKESPPVEINYQLVQAIEKDAEAERARKEALAEQEKRRRKEERELLAQTANILLAGITDYLQQNPPPANFVALVKASRALKQAMDEASNDEVLSKLELLQTMAKADRATSNFLVEWEEERQAEIARQEALRQQQEEERLRAEQEAKEARQRELMIVGNQYTKMLRANLAADLNDPDFETKLATLEQLEKAIAAEDYETMERIDNIFQSETVWCVSETLNETMVRRDCASLGTEFASEALATERYNQYRVWCLLSDLQTVQQSARGVCIETDGRAFASRDEAAQAQRNALDSQMVFCVADGTNIRRSRRDCRAKSGKEFASQDEAKKYWGSLPVWCLTGSTIENKTQGTCSGRRFEDRNTAETQLRKQVAAEQRRNSCTLKIEESAFRLCEKVGVEKLLEKLCLTGYHEQIKSIDSCINPTYKGSAVISGWHKYAQEIVSFSVDKTLNFYSVYTGPLNRKMLDCFQRRGSKLERVAESKCYPHSPGF